MKSIVKKSVINIFILGFILGGPLGLRSQEYVQLIIAEGPRAGVTFLPPAFPKWINDDTNQSKVEDSAEETGMFVSQIGWQFEERIIPFSDGGSLMIESLVLLGGLERSLILPSATFLAGRRSAKGTDIGIGPNLSLGGVGIAASYGTIYQSESVNIPLNFMLTSSKRGVQFSILVGFHARKI